MQKAVAYIRVSTSSQEEASPETQRQLMRDFAKGHKIEIVRFFSETHSARVPGRRPAYDDMLSFLRTHDAVQTVLVYKLDRLWRNEVDFGAFAALDDVRLISITENIPEGSTGRFLTTMYMAVATLESDKTRERVLDSALRKVQSGGWPGPAPTGYTNNRELKTIEVDPLMGAIVARVFEEYAYGNSSLSQHVKRAREIGLRTKSGSSLAKGALHHLLTNPFYYGALKWCGKVYPGNHPPLVSKTLFDRVQERLRAKATPKGKRRVFAFRGLLICGYCGCQLTAEIKKGKYVYYHCTQSRGKCRQPWHPQAALEGMLKSVVDDVYVSEETLRMLLAKIEEERDGRSRARQRRLQQLATEERRLISRRENAYMDLQDARIDDALWSGLDTRLAESLVAVRHEIDRLSSNRQLDHASSEQTLELLKRGPELYSMESDEEKAQHLLLLASNCVVYADNVDPTYREPFASVAEAKGSGIWLPGEDSNLQPFG